VALRVAYPLAAALVPPSRLAPALEPWGLPQVTLHQPNPALPLQDFHHNLKGIQPEKTIQVVAQAAVRLQKPLVGLS